MDLDRNFVLTLYVSLLNMHGHPLPFLLPLSCRIIITFGMRGYLCAQNVLPSLDGLLLVVPLLHKTAYTLSMLFTSIPRHRTQQPCKRYLRRCLDNVVLLEAFD